MSVERRLSTQEMMAGLNMDLKALAWVNFLKYLGNNTPKNDARATLDNLLEQYLATPNAPVKSPLYQTAEENVDELQSYINGDLKPEKSKIWLLLAPNIQDIDDKQYLESMEIKKMYLEAKQKIPFIIDKINSIFNDLKNIRQDLMPRIQLLKFTPEEFQMETDYKALVRKVMKLNRRLNRLTEKYETEGYDNHWVAGDNLRQNPNGIRQTAKWINKILAELNEINAEAKKLIEQYEILNNQLNAPEKNKSETEE
ncbi:MAG: hypothetical protein A2538_00040 [Candidatus Magasanikbacteria bacterium RIFOXYD2_FULL_41_14]|uniref:Uncharacterized protein n=1 Tax=Candidatus Magasanikbacteria bacterium RIFOXYD2_FULL_41_14 TaxID=1798709 RepID=A0A1F6PED3_9BACT|nr:MAG: hypothetical protein A2538_00040 [Candidatus Magasanikbacteria bacterium RIFOXYD2_FULL_41_14]